MYSKTKFALICIILLLFGCAAVSASDINSTGAQTSQADDSPLTVNNNISNEIACAGYDGGDVVSSHSESDFKQSNDGAVNQNFNQDTYSNSTNSSNESTKVNTKITSVSNKVVKGNYFQVYLKDENNTPVKNASLTFKLDKTVYDTFTDSNGLASFKITKNVGTYSVTVSFKGTEEYNSTSQTFSLIVPKTISIVIGNDKLLTNGYLRIYLKSDYSSVVSGRTLTITVGNKKFTKTTNSEGFVVFKPKVSTGNYVVTVSYGGSKYIADSQASKNVTGIKGDVRSPFVKKVPTKNGVPDIDYMPGNYVMGDGNAKYTLLKSQYRSVIKRDSYCLYLNKKLTKYVFFKTKSEPKYMHMIKREKWNVIERAINTKIVLKNKYGYWPKQITVNLKGKSYTYPEVRDVQNTGYTCGPTSSSMCSQVLRNYVNEWHLAKKAGTSSYSGSSTSGLKRALEKFNMKCKFYYKSSWSTAIKELKKGGCALVFHTWNHYVAILDISKDGKKVLVGNPSGDYDHGSHSIPTKWLTVKYMYKRFNNYDTSGLIVKLKYSLSKATKTKINKFYSNMGKWTRANTKERIPHVG